MYVILYDYQYNMYSLIRRIGYGSNVTLSRNGICTSFYHHPLRLYRGVQSSPRKSYLGSSLYHRHLIFRPYIDSQGRVARLEARPQGRARGEFMNKGVSLSKMRLTNDIARFICNCIATYPLSLYYTKMQKFLVVAFEFHTTRGRLRASDR